MVKETGNERLATLTPGCVFGELAVLYNSKRTASVRARTDVTLWSVDRISFQVSTKFSRLLNTAGRALRKYCIRSYSLSVPDFQ